MTAQTILLVLQSLTPWHEDRAEIGRLERLTTIAQSIQKASRGDRSMAAYLVTIGWWETRFSRRIHAGKCRPNECDRGRARSLWQMQKTGFVSTEQWGAIQGVKVAPTQLSAELAATIIRAHRKRCVTPFGTISMYATGKFCRWAPGHGRVRTYKRVLARLNAKDSPPNA